MIRRQVTRALGAPLPFTIVPLNETKSQKIHPATNLTGPPTKDHVAGGVFKWLHQDKPAVDLCNFARLHMTSVSRVKITPL